MKKKQYERPSVEVVVLNQQTALLQASGQAGVQNYNWSTETEE